MANRILSGAIVPPATSDKKAIISPHFNNALVNLKRLTCALNPYFKLKSYATSIKTGLSSAFNLLRLSKNSGERSLFSLELIDSS